MAITTSAHTGSVLRKVIIGAAILLMALPFARLALEPPHRLSIELLIALQPIVLGALLAYLSGLSFNPLIWGLRVRAAARRGELYLVWQPKTAVAGEGEMRSIEALVRWRAGEPRPPDRWVPYVERSFWMRGFNLWVLETAMKQARIWHETGVTAEVCVNLSPQFLADPKVPEVIEALLVKCELPAELLALEITERALIEGDCAADTADRLALLGVAMHLDDFGVGYSSLARLVELPLSGLKIDRKFVMALARDERAAAAVVSAVQLGQALGLTVCAEGVETPEVWHRLRLLGVDTVQGYLICRPLAAAELERWIEETGATYVPDRRTGVERRKEYTTAEMVRAQYGRDRRDGAERRRSARELLRERQARPTLLATDDARLASGPALS